MGRAPCCDKENVKKGPWSPEEDAKLKAYIEQYGTGGNWIALPQKIGMKRCGKSCRLRWLNYLRPNIKHGDFTEEDDNLICSLYISLGSRWSIIAAQLPGRTDNDIKNYWNTKLKKRLLGRRKQSNRGNIMSGLSSDSTDQDQDHSLLSNQDNVSHSPLSNSALERLQLHMQLQSLRNPTMVSAFLSNPASAMWAKLHPIQEKLLLQSINESASFSSLVNLALTRNICVQQFRNNNNNNDLGVAPISALQYTLGGHGGNNNNGQLDDHERNSDNNVVVQQHDQNENVEAVSSFQLAELEAFLSNNDNRTTTSRASSLSSGNFTGQEDELDFEYFKEMNCGSINWWSNVSE